MFYPTINCFRCDELKYEVVNIDDISTEDYDIIILSDADHGALHSPQKLIEKARYRITSKVPVFWEMRSI